MTVFGYVRVSTDRQASEGESLSVQERTIVGYAQMNGWKLDQVFCDRGVSGSTPLGERPAGGALLTKLMAEDTIVTPKLDRMFRSATDALTTLEKLKATAIRLHMIDLGGDVTGNGVAKLVFTILSAVAEAERDRIRERIAIVKSDQRRRGRYLGGAIPFGYTLTSSGDIIADSKVFETIAKLRADGHSLRSIASNFDGKVSHVTVGKILREADRLERFKSKT